MFYGHGIQSSLMCVLGLALSVASVLIARYSVALSLYAALTVAPTTVHFDGTSIHSLHSIQARTLIGYLAVSDICAHGLNESQNSDYCYT